MTSRSVLWLLSRCRTGARQARACTAVLAASAAAFLIPGIAAAKWEKAQPVDTAGTGYGTTDSNGALGVSSSGVAVALFFQQAPDTPMGNLVGSPFLIRRGAGATTAWSKPAEIIAPAGQVDSFPGPALAVRRYGGALGLFAFNPSQGSAQTLATHLPTNTAMPGMATPVLCTSAGTPECAASSPQVAVDASSNGYAVASTVLGGNGDILFARTAQSTHAWDPAQVIAQGYSPRLAVDPAGDAVVTYARNDPNAPSAMLGPFPRLYALRLLAGGSAWSTEQLISGSSEVTDAVDPSGTALVIDKSGNATAALAQGTEPQTGTSPPTGSATFAVRWPLGSAAPATESQISPAPQTEGGNADDAVLAVDPRGRVTAAWQVEALNTTIYAAQYTPSSGWASGAQVSPSNSTDSFSLPQLGADGLGTATLVYVDSSQSGSATLDALRRPAGKPWSAPAVISDSGTGAGGVVTGSVHVAAANPGQTDVIFVQALSSTNRLFATRFNDTTPPTITITTPKKGSAHRLHSMVLAHYSCQDEPGGSGIASCSGTVPDSKPINTSTSGKKTFTVTARDGAGNVARATVTYTVAAPPHRA